MKTLLCLLFTVGLFTHLNAAKFSVDFTVTSQEGCVFHIVGTVDIDIAIPLSNSTVNGFVGTISISGESGCPKGTFNVSFGMVSAGGSQGGFPPGDATVLNGILWNDSRMQQAISEILSE